MPKLLTQEVIFSAEKRPVFGWNGGRCLIGMAAGFTSESAVDSTVQEKAITFPTDAKLMHRARERLVRLVKKHGIGLRQSYARVGKFALIKHQRYAHAKQMGLSNRRWDVKHVIASRRRCRVHGCLRGRHQSPHDGAPRTSLQCGRRTLLRQRCNPISGMARLTSRQGRLRRSDPERYSQDFMLWRLHFDQRTHRS